MIKIILTALTLASLGIGCGFLSASEKYPFAIDYSLISFGLGILIFIILSLF